MTISDSSYCYQNVVVYFICLALLLCLSPPQPLPSKNHIYLIVMSLDIFCIFNIFLTLVDNMYVESLKRTTFQHSNILSLIDNTM